MSAEKILLGKADMDERLKELAKEYRKLSGNAPIEIVVVGGSAIVLDYGFREESSDMDVYYQGSTVIKEAARRVAEKNGLRDDWFNNDFIYSAKCNHGKLREHSHYYKDFGNGQVTVRILKPEYIIALKMLAAREFRNDISDIIGILAALREKDSPIDFNSIQHAVSELFDGYERIRPEIMDEVKRYCAMDGLQDIYNERVAAEGRNQEKLSEFNNRHPGIVNKDNANAVLEAINSGNLEESLKKARGVINIYNEAYMLDRWIVANPFHPDGQKKHKESNRLIREAERMLPDVFQDRRYAIILKEAILKEIPDKMKKTFLSAVESMGPENVAEHEKGKNKHIGDEI